MVVVATTAIVVAAANFCLFVGKQVDDMPRLHAIILYPFSIVIIVIVIITSNPSFMNTTGNVIAVE